MNRIAHLARLAMPDEALGPHSRSVAWCGPLLLPPEAEISMREQVYGEHMTRGFVGATVAAGGVGKSTLALHEAMAIATGLPIVGVRPKERAKVLYWNGEDPSDELHRRIRALAKHHRIEDHEWDGFLFVGSAEVEPLILAEGNPAEICEATIRALMDRIRALNISVLFFDPLVSIHRLIENDNSAMDRLVKGALGRIARETNCAVEVIHHIRKTGLREPSVEDSRGGFALNAAMRSMRVIRPMTSLEAGSYGVEPEDQSSFIRIEQGKANMAPTGRVDWYRLVNVTLENGDDVQALEPWSPPDPFAEVSDPELRAVQERVSAGRGPSREGWRANVQTGEAWVGVPISEVLCLDLTRPNHLRRVKYVLDSWIETGALAIVHRAKDARGKTAPFVEVGKRVETNQEVR